MALTPFRGFYDMQSEMNRLLNETLGSLALGPRRRLNGATEWAPVLDVLQEDGDIVVRAELPGVKQDDVDITYQNGVLTTRTAFSPAVASARAKSRRRGPDTTCGIAVTARSVGACRCRRARTRAA